MSDISSKDEVAKKRIISHMNADHSDTVARYVEYHHGVSRLASRHAKLTDISLASLTVSSSGTAYIIPIEPPMASLSEARTRLIEMDVIALNALHRSPITLKTYRGPRGFHAVVFVTCFLTYLLLLRESNVQPGSLLYDTLLRHVTPFARFVENVRLLVLVPMVLLHLIEAWFMTERMRKHSVPFGGSLWWAWVVSSFIEGVGSFQRIDAIVEEQRVAKEKAKH